LARPQILVERLMHVPQETESRHSGRQVIQKYHIHAESQPVHAISSRPLRIRPFSTRIATEP
jgi:hypothetical protein